jgi:amino acid adenylation domain-containing protein
MNDTAGMIRELRDKDIRLWLADGKLRYDAPAGAVTEDIKKRIANQRESLKEFLLVVERQQRLAQAIPVLDRTGDLMPSYGQQRLWLLDQLGAGQGYILTAGLCLTTIFPLNEAALESALNEVIARHEVLRTNFAFVGGRLLQRISAPATLKLRTKRFDELSDEKWTHELRALGREENRQPISMETGPLLRTLLVCAKGREPVLVLTMHHILTDGWSMAVFARELTAFYESKLLDLPGGLPPLPIQYADYAGWQRSMLEGSSKDSLLSYWRTQLADLPTLELPTDFPRAVRPDDLGGAHNFFLPRDTAEALKRLAEQQGASLFMALVACYQLMLAHYSGQTDIVVGTTSGNRKRKELEPLIGFFVNTLVLRTRVDMGDAFIALLKQVREVVTAAMTHEELPFEMLVEELKPTRTQNQTPLFQVLITLQAKGDAPDSGGMPWLAVSPVDLGCDPSTFDLVLMAQETEAGLKCIFQYRSDLFRPGTVARMADHFSAIANTVLQDPEVRLNQLDVLTEQERHSLLVEFRGPGLELPPLCLHRLIEAQVAKTPQAVALRSDQEQITFAEMNRRAEAVSGALRRMGVGPDVVVPLLLDRSVEMVVAILGVMKAGGAYLPLGTDYPPERLRYVIEDSSAKVVLTTRPYTNRLEGVAGVLEMEHAQLGPPSSESATPETPEQLAYVIYTSGSTGRPKGAMLAHRGLVNRLLWMAQHYEIGPADVILQKTNYTFDVSVWELLLGPLTGATTVLLKPGGEKDPAEVRRAIERHGVTTLHFVPSMLGVFLQSLPEATSLGALRRCICSGEALRLDQKALFFAKTDGTVALHNLYGPTEASVDVTYYPVRPDDTLIPIGKPVANTDLHILDPSFRLVPIGARGELCIGGVQIARGYLNRPELTAEKFVEHPFRRGERLYRTGDFARWLPDGNIEYLGRVDDQVKIRGFRIELGEIEVALAKHAEIRQTVVTAPVINHSQGQVLCAYYVAERELPASELKEHLRQMLPDYMVPGYFMRLEEIPVNSSGKADRKRLPRPTMNATRNYVAPRDDLEQEVSDAFARILGVQRVGIDDNFFELGGHSLSAVQLIEELKAEHACDLALVDFMADPNVAAVARQVKSKSLAAGGSLKSVTAVVGRAWDSLRNWKS